MGNNAYNELVALARSSLGGKTPDWGRAPSFQGADPVLPTTVKAGEAAAAALGACASVAANLWRMRGGESQEISIDLGAAAASMAGHRLQSIGGQPIVRPFAEDYTIGLYRGSNGRWLQLHGGPGHFQKGILDLLNCGNEPGAIAQGAARWQSDALEEALAYMGMCAGVVRERDEWRNHPQGAAIAQLPLVEVMRMDGPEAPPMEISERPLAGVRVLEIGQGLVGPICTRTLAEHGAEVMRLTPPGANGVSAYWIEGGHGKLSASLDLKSEDGQRRANALVSESDIVCHNLQPGVIERLGLGPDVLRLSRPGIIDVSINCYGHIGPWSERPGWDPLAQAVTGITDDQRINGLPTATPDPIVSYITGYLAAFGAMIALVRRAQEGGSFQVRTSLCQGAMWLQSLGKVAPPRDTMALKNAAESVMGDADTPFGSLRFVRPVAQMSATPPRWDRPPAPPGTHPPQWPANEP